MSPTDGQDSLNDIAPGYQENSEFTTQPTQNTQIVRDHLMTVPTPKPFEGTKESPVKTY